MRPARFGAPALFALAVLAVIAPTPARAGCQGHAASRTDGAALAGLEVLWDAGAPADPAKPIPADAPAPCTGAFCSGSPAVPVAPTVAPIEAPGAWATLIDRPEAPELSCQPLPFDESRFSPSFHGLAVFHPPRPAASASA